MKTDSCADSETSRLQRYAVGTALRLTPDILGDTLKSARYLSLQLLSLMQGLVYARFLSRVLNSPTGLVLRTGQFSRSSLMQVFQWLRASLGRPGRLVGPGWAHWAELNFGWAWAGLGLEVPSPGNPAGLVNVLSRLPDFDHDNSSSHCHPRNQNLSTQNLGMDFPSAARS